MLKSMTVVALVVLAGCSSAGKIERFQIDPPASARTMPNRLGTAVLRDVSLPQYASDQEIAYQTPDGAVRTNPKQIWADAPDRAITLSLASQISDVSGAQVIAEPWPLSGLPQRQIEVRFERLLAGSDNVLRMGGTYYVSSADGGNVVRPFTITVPIEGEGPAAIAAAQSRAVTELARRIAALN